jgi:uncharacterized membrane protein
MASDPRKRKIEQEVLALRRFVFNCVIIPVKISVLCLLGFSLLLPCVVMLLYVTGQVFCWLSLAISGDFSGFWQAVNETFNPDYKTGKTLAGMASYATVITLFFTGYSILTSTAER